MVAGEEQTEPRLVIDPPSRNRIGHRTDLARDVLIEIVREREARRRGTPVDAPQADWSRRDESQESRGREVAIIGREPLDRYREEEHPMSGSV
jgi:hypothetical protein